MNWTPISRRMNLPQKEIVRNAAGHSVTAACPTNFGEQMAHFFIATPMYGGMCTGAYTQSLLALVGYFSARGHQVSCAFMFNESLITRARNNMTHQFLQSQCTHMLWIDADIKFRPEDAYRMFEADKDVIGGIYPKKEINWQQVREAVGRGQENLANFTGSFVVNLVDNRPNVVVRQDQPCEVAALGTGFLMVKRKVYEKLKKRTPQFANDMSSIKPGELIYAFFDTPIDGESRRFLSEDYHFCHEWRRAGGKVYAAPWCQLGHMGTYLFEGTLIPTDEPCDFRGENGRGQQPGGLRNRPAAGVDGGSTGNAVGGRSKSTRTANSGQVRAASGKAAASKTTKPESSGRRNTKTGK